MESYLWLVVTAVIVIGVGVYVLVKMPGRKKARVLVTPGEAFELRCAPPDGRGYKVWVRYKVAFTSSQDMDTSGKEQFGLLFDVKVTASSRTILDRPMHLGYRQTDRDHRFSPDEFFTGTSREGNRYVRAGTFALTEVSEREPGTEIAIAGTIRATEGTRVKKLEVYVAA